MKIEVVAVSEIREYENNPRNNDEAVDVVAASIEHFGFKVPLVLDKDGYIVCGHTRLRAAKKIGLKIVPCTFADDLTEEEVAAFRLVDNKTAELAGWDFLKLDEELSALVGVDMSVFGFVASEDVNIDDLFGEESEAKPKEPKRMQCEHCGEWFEV